MRWHRPLPEPYRFSWSGGDGGSGGPSNVEGNRRHGFMEESVDAKGDGSEQVAQLEGVSLPDGSVRIR